MAEVIVYQAAHPSLANSLGYKMEEYPPYPPVPLAPVQENTLGGISNFHLPISSAVVAVPSIGYQVSNIKAPAIEVNFSALKMAKFLSSVAKVSAGLGIVILLLYYVPTAFNWVSGLKASNNGNYQLTQTEVKKLSNVVAQSRRTNYTPPLDESLPKTNRLIIPVIGITTNIQEATYDNYMSALEKGVWRVSDFGAPNANSEPTILAAHRFGYLAWSNLFRRQNSFYNLPKLKVGDTVEIDWQQRKYVYEIYATDQGTEITDYSADLILYTCVELNGPDRIFRYAKLITN